jgi:DNA-binding response OmpR family regulator
MRRVLLVEDDPDVCVLLARVLGEAGYEVVSARSFYEGKIKLEPSDFDLLVADVVLPAGRGTELAALAAEK